MKQILLLWLLAALRSRRSRCRNTRCRSGHRVHDVWADATPGGPVWISAQGSGHLGILDPKSGKFEFVPLGRARRRTAWSRRATARPGSPTADRTRSCAWIRRRAVKVSPLPEGSGYANLNTAIFDAKGVHWFTGQSGIYGRLDPASGKMEVFEAPKGRGPYGIHSTPDGSVYYASLAGSFVGRINADGSTTVIQPPTPRQGARRVWSDSKGDDLGGGMELGQSEPLLAEERRLENVEGAGPRAAGLRGVRRRDRQGVGLGVDARR